MTDDDRFLAICNGTEPPDPAFYKAGHDARSAGVAFHEGPRPFESPDSLSWRLGWNDRALELNR